MAEQGVSVRISAQGLETARRTMAALLAAGRDLAPVMDEIGSMLVASTIRRFELGQAPGGASWPPSRRAESEGGQTLLDSGRLRSSITHRAGRDQVEVGSNVVYARIHQLGGQAGRGRKVTIPARPYLADAAGNLDPGDVDEIYNIVADHLRGAGA